MPNSSILALFSFRFLLGRQSLNMKRLFPMLVPLLLSIICANNNNSGSGTAPPFAWDAKVSAHNAETFAQFIDHLFAHYRPRRTISEIYMEKHKRLMFYLIFVKYAAELAHFRLQHGAIQGACSGMKVGLGAMAFRFEGYLIAEVGLEQQLANEFNSTIICRHEKPALCPAVIDQLLLLTFSFAVRLLLNAVFAFYRTFGNDKYISRWQLQTLLTAYKQVSAGIDNTKSRSYGIFPYELTELVDAGRHVEWANLSGQDSASYQQNIENFKFIVQLSEFSLTPYKIYQVIGAILSARHTEPLYAFIENYFAAEGNGRIAAMFANANASSYTTNAQQQIAFFDCVSVHLGVQLLQRVRFTHAAFEKFVARKRKAGQCSNIEYALDGFHTGYELSFRSAPIEQQLFGELLSNYTHAIQYGAYQCVDVELTQFAGAMRQIIRSDLDDSNKTPKRMRHKFESLIKKPQQRMYKFDTVRQREANEFEIVLQLLKRVGEDEKYEMLTNLTKSYDQKGTAISDKKNALLGKILELFDQTVEEYSCTCLCPLLKEWRWKAPEFVEITPKFGQILFDTLQQNDASQAVKYDPNRQLLSLPAAVAEQWLGRLDALLREYGRSATTICQHLDFVQTMQSIASMGTLEPKRLRKNMTIRVNCQLFKLLFSLAFRLSIQSEESAHLARQRLKSFAFAYQCLEKEYSYDEHFGFFQFQINDAHGKVEIMLPNWRLPFYMYAESTKELRQEKANENFNFLHSLSNYPTTIYGILKMAEKLGEVEKSDENKNGAEKDHCDEEKEFILFNGSDTKTFCEIIQFLKKRQSENKGKTKVESKNDNDKNEKTENEFKIGIQNEFCILAFIVEELIEEIAEEGHIPADEDEEESEKITENEKNKRQSERAIGVTIGRLILAKEKCCKSKQFGLSKHFHENLLNFAKVITIEYDPLKNLRQIASVIIAEIGEMLQNGDWNSVNLKYTKMVEWNLCKYFLGKIGKGEKWTEISELRSDWEEMLDGWYFKGGEEMVGTKCREVMGKLRDILREFVSGNV